MLKLIFKLTFSCMHSPLLATIDFAVAGAEIMHKDASAKNSCFIVAS
jgi:hypothetical protein